MIDADIKAKIDEMLAALDPESMDYLRDRVPKRDGRSALYRVRLQLFKNGSLEADTDPEEEMNAPGAETIRGLVAVGQWARDIITAAHHADLVASSVRHTHPGTPRTIEGLSDEDIVKSIKSLRPSLSRNGGSHFWRLPYSLGDESEYLAGIRVVTVDE